MTGLALLVFAALPAWADEGEDVDFMAPFDENLTGKIRQTIDNCLGCHSTAGLNNPPRSGLNLMKLAKLLVDGGKYDHSAHGGLACTDCHAKGYGEAHGTDGVRGETKFCGSCHTRTFPQKEAEFKLSVHHKKWPDRFPCETCHNPHIYQSAAKIESPRAIVAQDNGFCLDCHEREERFRDFAPDKTPPDLDKVHAWLPHVDMHWKAVRCVDCHTADLPPGMSHEVQTKDKAKRRCADCHSVDSILRNRLFQHRVVDETSRINQLGFINAVMLPDHYLVGANRNVWLERASWVLVSLALAAFGLHALIRVIAAWRRRK